MFIQILLITISYLLGSIPFGIIFTRYYGVKDLRSHGSGNIGATNAMRVGGKKVGILTLTCDILKGVAPLYIVQSLYPHNLILLGMCGIAAVLGHIFPVWLKFKGGRGVATTLAVILMFDYVHALFSLGIWIISFGITRTSSVSSIIMMLISSIIGYFHMPLELAFANLLLAFLVIYRHKDNISRILKGKEKSLI